MLTRHRNHIIKPRRRRNIDSNVSRVDEEGEPFADLRLRDGILLKDGSQRHAGDRGVLHGCGCWEGKVWRMQNDKPPFVIDLLQPSSQPCTGRSAGAYHVETYRW